MPNKIKIINNGIDCNLFSPTKKIRIANRINLGMAARFTGTKRQDILVNTILELNNKCSKYDWHLSLAGDGENLINVMKIANLNKVDHFVTFTGNLNEQELVSWFHQQDIYLLASDGETLSTSLLQAMSCQIPIVASNVPGINNLLCNEINNDFLVSNDSSNGFANAILKLVKDESVALGNASSGRQYVLVNNDNKLMFKKYNDIINGII